MPVRIQDILQTVTPLTPDMRVSAALQQFLGLPGLMALPVVTDGVPLGIVSRADLMELCFNAGPDGVVGRQPVFRLMRKDPPLAETTAPVAYIASKLGAELAANFQHGVIAIEEGRYAGHVSAGAILSAVAEENAARAKAMKAGAAALTTERQKALAAKQEQSRLLAFLGHEIRTPLTGILGVADLLGDTDIDGSARDYAATISESGRHLDRILGDFLDLTRLEAGKLLIAPAPFKVKDLANETRNLWAGRSRDSRVTLKVTSNDRLAGQIEADGTRLRQILFNLIGNAVKFTEAGTIAAHIETVQRGSGPLHLVMTVTDTGVGIPDADKARLFEAFEQASPGTVHKFGGTGLGLSIAKGLVERMGGKITLADNPEGGTIFKVVCPVRKAGPRLAVENKRQRKANFKLGNILLLEDHDVSRLVIGKALGAVGWKVDHVATVEQAKRRAMAVPYQALLLDLHVTDGSGTEVARAVRERAGPNQHAPVLAVTADVSQVQKDLCKGAGFTSFVAKPIRPRDLVATLADAIVSSVPLAGSEPQLKAV